MGAEGSVLQGCKLDEPLKSSGHSHQPDWVIHPARRDDGSQVSVFVHKGDRKSEDARVQNAAKQLKVLRHPTILKFFASCKNVEGTYLITEQVKPLDLVLENLSSEEICVGMYNIIEALSFLHTRGGVSHNNVCTSSIYVSSQDGGWRLGAMEHLCKFEDATVQFLKDSKPLRHSEAIPPEEKEDSLTSNAPSLGHARDAYAFGILAEHLLQYLEELGDITNSFVERLNSFIDPEPKKRPQLRTLLQDHIFRNDFLEIIKFLNHLTLKTEQEKNIFFEDLAPRLHGLPAKLVAIRLAPMLLSSFVMAEPVAVDKLFVHLLTPKTDTQSSIFNRQTINPIIPEELFKKHILPLLIEAFQLRDSHVRCVLLRHFSSYVHLFDHYTLRSTILVKLLVGLKDTNDDIVSATFHALAEVVPILGSEIVVGGDRFKYFVEGRPKFHTKKENGALQQKHEGNLTAVSGVIGLPLIEKIVKSNHQANETNLRNQGEDEEKRKLAREQERQQKREEMKRKNEERKKEREQRLLNKQHILGKTIGEKDRPLMANESMDSVSDTHADDTNVHHPETGDSDWSDWEADTPILSDNQTNPSTKTKDNSEWQTFNKSSKFSNSNLETQNYKTEQKGALKLQTGKNVSKTENKRHKIVQELGKEFIVPDVAPKPEAQEFDFFADMEPSIGKTQKNVTHSTKTDEKKTSEQDKSKFTFQMDDSTTMEGDAGWGDDDLNWDFEDE
ncbi:protein-associating with the carboxyl-terminal domain of ezrin-like [Antedon mediterranea]|uniref:protein-associating with the carboxyl-terminal domain of ezrin-like n=1 Tax=Antedon mediterranea TaxID=105859 RepID=UPI003AF872FD